MTGKEAKKVLDVIRSYYIGQASVTKNEYPKETIAGYSLADVSNACLYGSKALEQEPCDDAISRQATVEKLCKIAEFMNEKSDGLGSPYVMAALFIQDNKDEFPPVTPQPKTGHWIDMGYTIPSVQSNREWRCDNCQHQYRWFEPTPQYCPNCGAKMESEE